MGCALARPGLQLLERLARGSLAAAAERTTALVGELPLGELAQRGQGALVAQVAERTGRARARLARLALGHAHQLLQAAALAALRRLGIAVRRRAEGAARFLDARVGEDALLAVLDLLELLAGGAEVVLGEGALDGVGAPGGEEHGRGQKDDEPARDRHLGLAGDARDPRRGRRGQCAHSWREPAVLAARPGRAGAEEIEDARSDVAEGAAGGRDGAGHGSAHRRDGAGRGRVAALEQTVRTDAREPPRPGEADAAERQVGTA